MHLGKKQLGASDTRPQQAFESRQGLYIDVTNTKRHLETLLTQGSIKKASQEVGVALPLKCAHSEDLYTSGACTESVSH